MTGKAAHVLGNFLQPRSKGQRGVVGGRLPAILEWRRLQTTVCVSARGNVLLWVCFAFCCLLLFRQNQGCPCTEQREREAETFGSGGVKGAICCPQRLQEAVGGRVG